MGSRAEQIVNMVLNDKRKDFEKDSRSSSPASDSSVDLDDDEKDPNFQVEGCDDSSNDSTMDSRSSSPARSVPPELEFLMDDEVTDSNFQVENCEESLDDSALGTTANEIVGENTTPKKRKISNPSQWKRNVQKQRRLQGQSYTTVKGKTVAARPQIEPRCLKKPKHSCSALVPLDVRSDLYKQFHSLENLTLQRSFITKHVTIGKPKRRTTENSRRGTTKCYNFTVNGEKKNVCREFFLDVLNIPEGTVLGAIAKMNETGYLMPDMRGKKTPPQKISDEREAFIIEHIRSFPTLESHYCRKSTEYKFLDSSLNISIMHKLYKEKCNETTQLPVSLEKYRKVFRRFKLKFHKPKKDLCKICVANKEKSDNSNEEAFLSHLQRKELARQCRNEDKEAAKNDPATLSFNFDLQAVLNTPKGAAGPIFYVRKLAVYNLCVYNLGSADVMCYLWDESEGKRGSVEISTCIYKFIMEKKVKHVRMMSDGCGGQQKNINFIVMCNQLMKDHETLEIIDHKFFETGHSQMECDSIHSKIEQKCKHVPVYTPEGWAQLIRTARSNPSPFQVTTLLHDDFLNFNKMNYKIKSEEGSIKFRDIVWLQFRREEPDVVYTKTEYEENFSKNFLRKKRGRPSTGEPMRMYLSKLKVSAAKFNDLQMLCKNLVIPKAYHAYYNNLPNSNSVRDALAEPDFEESDSEN